MERETQATSSHLPRTYPISFKLLCLYKTYISLSLPLLDQCSHVQQHRCLPLSPVYPARLTPIPPRSDHNHIKRCLSWICTPYLSTYPRILRVVRGPPTRRSTMPTFRYQQRGRVCPTPIRTSAHSRRPPLPRPLYRPMSSGAKSRLSAWTSPHVRAAWSLRHAKVSGWSKAQ